MVFFHFGLTVHFQQDLKSQFLSQQSHILHQSGFKYGRNEQYDIRPVCPGLMYLERINYEILPEKGKGWFCLTNSKQVHQLLSQKSATHAA